MGKKDKPNRGPSNPKLKKIGSTCCYKYDPATLEKRPKYKVLLNKNGLPHGKDSAQIKHDIGDILQIFPVNVTAKDLDEHLCYLNHRGETILWMGLRELAELCQLRCQERGYSVSVKLATSV